MELVESQSSVMKPGDRYGRYTVLGILKQAVGYQKYALVQCDCGTAPRRVQIGTLRNGESQSCGCHHRERVTKHGMWQTPLFKVWKSMVSRCTNTKNKSYRRYGGRGIRVCDEWLDLHRFVADMEPTYQPGLTLDRRNNDGPYCLENCRWATHKEQNRNYSRNRLVTHEGKTKCLVEWAEELGINRATLWDRLFVQKLPPHLALRT